jgi:plasmid stabilization system protein ParE
MKTRFLPEAKQEYSEAARFYRAVDQTLANRSVEEIEEGIAIIQQRPSSFSFVDLDVRRCRVKTFPYGILYTHDHNEITIWAIMHFSRKPGYRMERRP